MFKVKRLDLNTSVPMRYPAAETAEKHERIIDEASRLFRIQGFDAVSVGEIMQATGLTHGPFYNHFSSKEALMAAAVERGIGQTVGRLEQLDGSAADRARYFDRYLSSAHRDNPGTGCTFAALATEAGRTTEARSAFTSGLKRALETAASRVGFRPRTRARSKSIQSLAALVGGVILARAVDDPALSDEILREVRAGLKAAG